VIFRTIQALSYCKYGYFGDWTQLRASDHEGLDSDSYAGLPELNKIFVVAEAMRNRGEPGVIG